MSAVRQPPARPRRVGFRLRLSGQRRADFFATTRHKDGGQGWCDKDCMEGAGEDKRSTYG